MKSSLADAHNCTGTRRQTTPNEHQTTTTTRLISPDSSPDSIGHLEEPRAHRINSFAHLELPTRANRRADFRDHVLLRSSRESQTRFSLACRLVSSEPNSHFERRIRGAHFERLCRAPARLALVSLARDSRALRVCRATLTVGVALHSLARNERGRRTGARSGGCFGRASGNLLARWRFADDAFF